MNINSRRILATFIDHIIIIVILAIVIFVFGDNIGDNTYRANSTCAPFFIFFIFFYFPISHIFFGKSLGKKICKLEIAFNSNKYKNNLIMFLLFFIRNFVSIFENLIFFYLLPIFLLNVFQKRLSDIFTNSTIKLSNAK